jgi:hypothetical protein
MPAVTVKAGVFWKFRYALAENAYRTFVIAQICHSTAKPNDSVGVIRRPFIGGSGCCEILFVSLLYRVRQSGRDQPRCLKARLCVNLIRKDRQEN